MEIAKALILAEPGDRRAAVARRARGHAAPRSRSPTAPILDHSLEALSHGGILEATILAGAGRRAVDQRARSPTDRDWGLSVRCAEHRRRAAASPARSSAARDFIGDEPVLVQRGRRAPARALARAHRRVRARGPRRARAAPRSRRVRARHAADARLPAQPARARRSCSARRRGRQPGARRPARAAAGCASSPSTAACPATATRTRCWRATGAMLEEHPPPRTTPASVHDTEIQGRSWSTRRRASARSTLRGPLIIGPGARVSDAYIGPYTVDRRGRADRGRRDRALDRARRRRSCASSARAWSPA